MNSSVENAADKSIDQTESEDGVKESRKKQKIDDDDDDYDSDPVDELSNP